MQFYVPRTLSCVVLGVGAEIWQLNSNKLGSVAEKLQRTKGTCGNALVSVSSKVEDGRNKIKEGISKSEIYSTAKALGKGVIKFSYCLLRHALEPVYMSIGRQGTTESINLRARMKQVVRPL